MRPLDNSYKLRDGYDHHDWRADDYDAQKAECDGINDCTKSNIEVNANAWHARTEADQNKDWPTQNVEMLFARQSLAHGFKCLVFFRWADD